MQRPGPIAPFRNQHCAETGHRPFRMKILLRMRYIAVRFNSNKNPALPERNLTIVDSWPRIGNPIIQCNCGGVNYSLRNQRNFHSF
jgi:hypothetical protein